ncbi:MAG TPA: acetyl-CoA C-acyltransferase [Candidatus Polarisedimenticolia bacterium]|jgi:acetyl-CoA acetyltransferase family protein|nr:acetyl-CoA C-acyltransferase [Candidatus Polarisedimenticolia bacterium]
MTTRDAVIVAGARTPMATYNTHFKDLPETALGALAAKAALERAKAAPQRIDHVVVGNALQTSGNAIYGARHVALKAGLPETVPALTVNRLCGSGLQAVSSAADLLALGEAEVVLAGGMENMTQAPHVLRGMRSGLKMGNAVVEDLLVASLLDTQCGCSMSQTAENLAEETGITRAEADAYALLSQQRAEAAVKSGRLAEEIVPVTVRDRGRDVVVSEDNHRRPETTLEGLAKLPAAFGGRGFVTAGNASGIVDGAAAVVVASPEAARDLGGRPLGRMIAAAVVGVPPRIMGIGPVPAIRKALERAGLGLKEIDLFEINEAFAAQYLACEKGLGLDRDRVNVNGGAIALGHPLGATGTRLVLTLLLELRRRGGRFGVASACIGGGQGIALVLEASPAGA